MATRIHQHLDHITPLKVYITVGLTLLIFTGLTVIISRIHLGAWNAIVALGIASIKALLVALFFMHLLYDRKIYMIIVSIALVMLGILIALTMADILRRGDIYEFQAGPIAPKAKIYNQVTGQPLKLNEHSESPASSGHGDSASALHEGLTADTTETGAIPEAEDSIVGDEEAHH
jgi:cytochrome c oxidase subunit 4